MSDPARPAATRGTTPAAVPAAGGLSAADAAERLARYGPNELPRARRTPVWQLIAGQVRDPLIVVLLAAAALTVATGDWADATSAGLTEASRSGRCADDRRPARRQPMRAAGDTSRAGHGTRER